jgi:4-alpha-glucanotransferase
MLPEAITPEVETELSDLTTTYYRVPGTKEPELPK